jgi:hypothetical protein
MEVVVSFIPRSLNPRYAFPVLTLVWPFTVVVRLQHELASLLQILRWRVRIPRLWIFAFILFLLSRVGKGFIVGRSSTQEFPPAAYMNQNMLIIGQGSPWSVGLRDYNY